MGWSWGVKGARVTKMVMSPKWQSDNSESPIYGPPSLFCYQRVTNAIY